MQTWARTSLILCVFGFLKEFRPSEPYVTQYLVGPWKNLTDVEVNQQIFPVITYSYLSLLVLVFLVTDALRYKVVIILQGITGSLSSLFMVIGKDVPTLQVMSFMGGAFYATDIAYFTYIYAKVDRKYFQRVTSYTQTAFLLGRFMSYALGQVLVSTSLMDYQQLNYITLGAYAIALLWAFFLPPVKGSIYFNKREPQKIDQPTVEMVPVPGEKDVSTVVPQNIFTTHVFDTSSSQAPVTCLEKCTRAGQLLWQDFKDAYTNWYIVKWSIWWALAMCGFIQGFFYIQLLWENIATDSEQNHEELLTKYNGGIEAICTVIGAAAAFGCGWLRVNWEVLGEATLAACALLQGGALIMAAYADNIWMAYLGFIIFVALYYPMFTIVNSEVAKHINEDSYGLIFGVNTFFALVLQTILTVVVVGEGGLALGIRLQYVVYGGFFLTLGAIFAVIALATLCSGKLKNQPLWLPREAPTTKASIS